MAPYTMNGVALVTGAASGMGRVTAIAFAEEGVTRLILADINLDGLHETEAQLKQISSDIKTIAIRTDTSDEASVQNMVDEGVKAFGSIQYAVNSAGVTSYPRVKSTEMTSESWDRVMSVNLRGVWLCQRAQIRQMLKQDPIAESEMRTHARAERGSIVNIASVIGLVGDATCGSYAASKAGLMAQSRVDAAGYGNDGIRVNSVCPGIIYTPLLENSMKLGRPYAKMLETVPINRFGKPEEVAQTCVFLASTRASFITGEEITVDGGLVKVLRS